MDIKPIPCRRYDVLAVGGGYWGSAVALEARRAGKSVLVLDDGDPRAGSRNASAICDPAAYTSSVFRRYWPSDWTKEQLDRSLDWLFPLGAYWVRERFWNTFRGTAPREGALCLYLPSPDTLTRFGGPRRRGKVTLGSVGADGVTLRTEMGEEFEAANLVVTAGYRTDEVLRALGVEPLGVRPLYGRGLTARAVPTHVPLPVSVMIRPYVKHTVRQWIGGRIKVGDTAEETPSAKKAEGLEAVAGKVLEDLREVEWGEGYRPVLDRYTVEKLSPSLIVATGGNRVGLGLSGLVARKVMEMLR